MPDERPSLPAAALAGMTGSNEVQQESFTAASALRSARSMVIESPAVSYFLSETRLYAYLLANAATKLEVDLGPALFQPSIQKVLSRAQVCAEIDPKIVSVDTLRYIAHIYNCTLGTDFVVVSTSAKTYFLSDGAMRRRIEDLQEEGKHGEPVHARQWSEAKLKRFLEELSGKYPRLEQHLLTVSPERGTDQFPSTLSRTQPLYVKEIVIPTANRAADVKRLLSSLATNFEFYGYHPSVIRIRIIDTSTSSEQAAATRAAVKTAKHAGLQVEYLGREDVRNQLLAISEHLNGPALKAFKAVMLRGLFSQTQDASVPLSIGTIRNAIALLLAGEPYISIDDDMILEAPVARYKKFLDLEKLAAAAGPSLDLHVGAAVDFMRSTSHTRAEFQAIVSGVPTDIIGIANRTLDTPRYVLETRIVGAPTFSPFRSGDGRVSCFRPYIANASPDVTIYLRKFMQTANVGELSGADAPASLQTHLPAACLHCGYSSGTMFATSNGLEAPFLDARAYEDVAQTHLSEFLYGNDLQFQGGVIEHRRAVGSRVMNSIHYVDVMLGFYMMTRYLSPSFPGSLLQHDLSRERDRIAAFRRLGKALFRDGHRSFLSDHELQEFTAAYLQMRQALKAAGVAGAETFSADPEQVHREFRFRHRLLLQTNGLLMHYWPEFARAAEKTSELRE